MKVIGIIAEYNPFHNGHAYQLQKIKELTHADYVVIALSGDFMQRGMPAMLDKYARTDMALSCGADLVFELPAVWATASAEFFAAAGVALLEKTGCIDTLCFGAECDNLAQLSAAADILAAEPQDYKKLLASYLKEGLNFPAARSLAMTQTSACSAGILDTPNNILAVEYLKACKNRTSSMQPYPLLRQGAAYHEDRLDTKLPSAAAIRSRLLNPVLIKNSSFGTDSSDSVRAAMPAAAYSILSGCLQTHAIVCEEDLSEQLFYLLLSTPLSQLLSFADMTEDIAHRLQNNLSKFSSFSQYCKLCKSKDVTYTRISRIFSHILLNIRKSDYETGRFLDYIPYLRILGFQKSAAPLLHTLRSTASVPIISKLADAGQQLSADACTMLRQDIFAAELYDSLTAHKCGRDMRSEYTRSPVIHSA